MSKFGQETRDFLQLDGKRIVITGASSGIGRTIAFMAADFGAAVVLVGRNANRLAEVFQGLAGEGHSWVSTDLADLHALPMLATKILGDDGAVDGLIHAAGIHLARPVATTTTEDLLGVFQLNVYAPFLLSQALRNQGVKGRSLSIVFLGSASTIRGSGGVSAYSSSKAAMADLAKSIAVEWAKDGIRSNVVTAGMVDTPMTESIRETIGESAWTKISLAHPLGVGFPSDVAKAALYLVSPASKWVTGTMLCVDGGYSIA